LKKISELRNQLQRICCNVFPPSGPDHPDLTRLNPPINPPTKQQESALRQVILDYSVCTLFVMSYPDTFPFDVDIAGWVLRQRGPASAAESPAQSAVS